MKTDSQQQLLEQYREGTLGESGLAELNRLSHRDEVMAAAGQRAAGIIRRRTRVGIGVAVATLLMGGAAVWALLPPSQETPMVAEAVVPEAVPESPVTVEDAVIPEPKAPVTHVATARPRKVRKQAAEEPVVMCNNQCEADSVISDIWKFLTV